MNGKQEGVGIYYNQKGEVRYGKWQNGKRVNWISEEEFKQTQQQIQANKAN